MNIDSGNRTTGVSDMYFNGYPFCIQESDRWVYTESNIGGLAHDGMLPNTPVKVGDTLSDVERIMGVPRNISSKGPLTIYEYGSPKEYEIAFLNGDVLLISKYIWPALPEFHLPYDTKILAGKYSVIFSSGPANSYTRLTVQRERM